LAAEDFWRYIGQSEVPLQKPSHLSAVTVAKGIEYGVKLLGCFIEGYVGAGPGLGKEADFGKMTRGALEFARGTFATYSGEHNWYDHPDRRLASLPVAGGSPQYMIFALQL
jgi:hypothetical protein